MSGVLYTVQTDSNKWKRDSAICFLTIIVMFLFVGFVFGLLFGELFDMTDYLLPRFMGIMFIISLVTILVCCITVPDTPKPVKGWLELKRCDYGPMFSAMDVMSERLCMPTPRLYISPDPFPNAYALGKSPKRAHVCLSRGLMMMFLEGRITDEELIGIIGHEMSHIAHRDTLVKGIAQRCTSALTSSSMIVGLISIMFLGSVNQSTGKRSGSNAGVAALFLLVIALVFIVFAAILAVTIPGACVITKFAVSRNREYLADETSARITNNPMALASALMKIDEACLNGYASVNAANAMKWTVDPNCKKKRGFMDRITDTHPSTEDRVKRLKKMAEDMDS